MDEDSLDDEGCAPIIQRVSRIIEEAHNLGASDIHIEPREKELVVPYRIDGVCREKLRLPIKVIGLLIARLKIMSNWILPSDGYHRMGGLYSNNLHVKISTSICVWRRRPQS